MTRYTLWFSGSAESLADNGEAAGVAEGETDAAACRLTRTGAAPSATGPLCDLATVTGATAAAGSSASATEAPSLVLPIRLSYWKSHFLGLVYSFTIALPPS